LGGKIGVPKRILNHVEAQRSPDKPQRKEEFTKPPARRKGKGENCEKTLLKSRNLESLKFSRYAIRPEVIRISFDSRGAGGGTRERYRQAAIGEKTVAKKLVLKKRESKKFVLA